MPLVGCLMLGNLMKECGVVDRLSKTVQNELMNIVVIFLGLTRRRHGDRREAFLNFRTLGHPRAGRHSPSAWEPPAACAAAKFMNLFSKEENKINPPDRFGRRVGRTRWPPACRRSKDSAKNPGKLPADARHGSQRGRRGRFGRRRRYPAVVSSAKGNAPKREERGFRNPRSSLFIPAATPCATGRPVRASRRPPARARCVTRNYGWSSARRSARGRPDRSAPRDGRNAPAKPPDRPPATFRRRSTRRPPPQSAPHGRTGEPPSPKKTICGRNSAPVGGRGISTAVPTLRSERSTRDRARSGVSAVRRADASHGSKPARSCRVVYILGDDLDVEIRLQSRDGQMSRIGTGRQHLAAAFVVNSITSRRVARQRLGRTDILDPVIGPQAARHRGRWTVRCRHSRRLR